MTSEEKIKVVFEKNTNYKMEEDLIEQKREKINKAMTQVDEMTWYGEKGILKHILMHNAKEREHLIRLLSAVVMGISKEKLNGALRLVEEDQETRVQLGFNECRGKYGDNAYVRGVLKLLFHGSEVRCLNKSIWDKLAYKTVEEYRFYDRSARRRFTENAMNGTLSANIGKFCEETIWSRLDALKIPHKGKKFAERDVDAIIPHQNNPLIVIESSYCTTTTSDQTNKAKTMGVMVKYAKEKRIKTIAFIDGIGWRQRGPKEVKRATAGYDYVYTFKESELERFSREIGELWKQIQLSKATA